MKKVKIAFAIHAIGEGGAERVTTLLCNRFIEQGYEVHLITNHKRDWEYPVVSNVKRHIIGESVSKNRLRAFMQRIYRMRNICKSERFDVLIGMMGMSEYSVFATTGLGIPNIISIRSNPDVLYPSFLKKSFTRVLLSTASGAVFQTEYARDWFPAVLRKKSEIIFNPLSDSFYNVICNPEKGRLVSTGRLTQAKNYPMMLRAIKKVLSKEEIHLDIYGKGDEKEKISSLVSEMGLSGYVHFWGQCNNIPEVLSKAEVFLLTSNYEGLPNGLMEAMAVGVPCISTDCAGGAARLLLGNNERGLVTPVKDDSKFAEAILNLLHNEELKKTLSSNSREFAKRFSMNNCFQDWERYILSKVK